MLDLLLQPLSEPFFVRALLAVLLSGTTCACLGAYVVLRRMAFVSTALTHSILPGVVGALLLGLSPYLGALVAALLTAAGAAWLASRKGTSEDSAVGVMLSVMFAAGIALMQQANSWRDFAGLLFGSVVSVGGEDLLVIGVTAGAVSYTHLRAHET
jgi:ABC-type Mn2+/Zn2+ transport system permease subunit